MSSIRSKDLARAATQSFTLPEVCLRIREMLDDKASGMDEIGELVLLDPSLSSKLLKLANSPLFRFESQIDSIGKAVSVIGGEALYNLVMAETASSAFEHFSSDVIDLKRFWLQSVYCGLIAKHLAKIARLRGSERFFLMGLLHNLGELIVAVQAPEMAIKCNAYDESISPWKLQNKILGFQYVQCSAELLSEWRLPESIYYPVMNIHNENKALENKEIGILYTAARAAVALANSDLYNVGQLISPLVQESLNLTEEDIADAVKFGLMEADGILAIMNPTLTHAKPK